MGNNMFSGGIPSHVGPNLKYLSLRGCQLSGPISPSLYTLTGHVQVLDLSGNHQLSGTISPSVAQLNGSLACLDLSHHLTGDIPSNIGSSRQLQILNLSHNKLTGNIPPSLGKLKALLELILDDNLLSGAIREGLAAKLKKLESMDLSRNLFTGPIPHGAPFSSFPVSSFDRNASLWESTPDSLLAYVWS